MRFRVSRYFLFWFWRSSCYIKYGRGLDYHLFERSVKRSGDIFSRPRRIRLPRRKRVLVEWIGELLHRMAINCYCDSSMICEWDSTETAVKTCIKCGFSIRHTGRLVRRCDKSIAGFGDWLARVFGWIGFKQTKGCGCGKRQATLNRWIPFDHRVWRARLLWLTFPFTSRESSAASHRPPASEAEPSLSHRQPSGTSSSKPETRR